MGKLTVNSARSYSTASKQILLSRSTASVQQFAYPRRNFIAEASNQTKSDSDAKKKTKSTSTTTRAKSTTPKKAKTSATKKPKKAKKVAVKKLHSWEKMGSDGKLLPLPSASKPKRRSSYLIYISKRVPELRNDPSLQGTGKDGQQKFEAVKAIKRIAEEWNSMSESERAPINAEAKAEAEQYERAMERWRNALTPEDIKRENAYITSQRKKGKSGLARLRDPAKPKMPQTPFFRFYDEYRKKNASDSIRSNVTEFSKKASAEWKKLTESEKEPYTKGYAEERERYIQKMKEWKSASGLV